MQGSFSSRKCEADHLPVYNVDVKNKWKFISRPHIHIHSKVLNVNLSFCLIKHNVMQTYKGVQLYSPVGIGWK